jgi:hypothetical protein
VRKRRLLKYGGLLALIALVISPARVLAASGGIRPAASLCDYPVLQQLCSLGSLVSSGVTSATSTVTQDFLSQIVSWISGSAAWVLDHVVSLIQNSSAVNINGSWFKAHYTQMIVLSSFVMLPVLIIAAMKAAFVGEGGPLALAVFLYLPFTIVLTFVAVPIVNGLIGSVDWMSNAASYSLGADYKSFVNNIATAVGGHGGASLVAPFVALISSIFIVILGLMLVVVMLARNASVYITAVLIPFALAPIVIPGMSGIAKKLFAMLLGSILIKFLIVVSIAVGVGALGAVSQCDPTGANCNSFATVLAGIAILITAIVLPYNLINLLIVSPILSQGASGMAIINGARGAAALPMGTSQQIYAGIRHNTVARISTTGAGATRLPRIPTSYSGAGMAGGMSRPGTVINAPVNAAGVTHAGGGISGAAGRGQGSNVAPRSTFMGRARNLVGSATRLSSGSTTSTGGGGGIRPGGGSPRTPRS